MFLPGLNAAIDELHCRQAVVPDIAVNGSRDPLRCVHLAKGGTNRERSGMRLLAGARRIGRAATVCGIAGPAIGELDKLCKGEVAERRQNRDWHYPYAPGSRGGSIGSRRGVLLCGRSEIGSGRGSRCAVGAARTGDRFARIAFGRVRAGRQLTKESVLGLECSVGDVYLLHALLGMSALRAVGRKAVRVELPDEPSVTSLHGAPVVSARTEAKSPIPEGDVAVGHGSDTDAPLMGERTDRALSVNCNVIRDSRRNLMRGVGMAYASR